MTALSKVHEGARVVVCVGPGGVGKTTLAAALAIDAADRGRRVALVTIDPAHRLADALGLAGHLDDALREVRGAPGLEAAMLDTRASFDALVTRIARGDGDRERILANRIYRAFSRTLARPHAYVAMERLHDLVTQGAHDLVVLDTPPTRSALDILDAPGRLARFVGSSVAESLVSSHATTGLRAWARGRGRAVVTELLARLLGQELATELAAFFEVFLHLRAGFAQRADAVQTLLRDESTRFVLVVAPEASHLDDARALAAGLASRGAHLDAVLSNRVARLHGEADAPTAPGSETRDPVLLRARAHQAAARRSDARRRTLAANLVKSLENQPTHVVFPWEDAAPVDVPGLRRLGRAGGEFASVEVSS